MYHINILTSFYLEVPTQFKHTAIRFSGSQRKAVSLINIHNRYSHHYLRYRPHICHHLGPHYSPHICHHCIHVLINQSTCCTVDLGLQLLSPSFCDTLSSFSALSSSSSKDALSSSSSKDALSSSSSKDALSSSSSE